MEPMMEPTIAQAAANKDNFHLINPLFANLAVDITVPMVDPILFVPSAR